MRVRNAWAMYGFLWARLSIILFLLGYVLVNACWIYYDERPPMIFDDGAYLWRSLDLYRTLRDQGVWRAVQLWPGLFRDRAPLIAAVAIPFYFLFGESTKIALLSILILSCASLAVLWALTTRLFDHTVATLSMVLFACFPLVYHYSHLYMTEPLLLFLSLLHVTFLLRRKGSHLVRNGGLLGFGLLAKITYPLYIAGPLLQFLSSLCRETSPSYLVRYVGIVGGIAILLASSWYIPNISAVAGFALANAYGELGRQYYSLGPIFSLASVYTYWQLVFSEGTSFFFLGGLFWQLGLFLRQRFSEFRLKAVKEVQSAIEQENVSRLLFLFLWFLPPALIFTFNFDRAVRFLLPALPPLAILFAWLTVYNARRNFLGSWVGTTLVILGMLYNFFATVLPPPQVLTYSSLPTAGHYARGLYWQERYDILLQFLQSSVFREEKEPSLYIAWQHLLLNVNTLVYLAKLRNVSVPWLDGLSHITDPKKAYKEVAKYRWVVVETQPTSPQVSVEAKDFHTFILTSGLFQEYYRSSVSDGSTLIFLRRRDHV